MSKNAAEIYTIVCKTTNKVYVGSAISSAVRFRNHRKELNKGIHNNPYLQHAWNKYGEGDFEWVVVDKCPLDERWKVEQQWINKFCACDPNCGFNVMHSATELLPSPLMSKLLKDYWAERWSDYDYSKQRTEQLRDIVNRPEVKAKMSLSKLTAWADPEYRKRQVASQKRVAGTQESRKQNSERLRKLWQDPEYRAKQMAERGERFKDPKFRKKLSIAASNRKRKIAHNEIV